MTHGQRNIKLCKRVPKLRQLPSSSIFIRSHERILTPKEGISWNYALGFSKLVEIFQFPLILNKYNQRFA